VADVDERTPESPPAGEVAGSNIGGRMAPYIGELDADPRIPQSRYRYAREDRLQELALYREVLRDERCAAAFDQRLNACISRPWEVRPGGDMRRDKQAAEDVADQLRALDFDGVCRQLLYSVWYGYAVAEALWMMDGERVRLEALKVRAVDRFLWQADGSLLLRTESHPHGEQTPAGKFVQVCPPGEHGDVPHGPGLARWCYWPVWLKRNGIKFWALALEKFAAPTPVGKYHPGAGEAEKDKLLQILSSMATGAGVAIPETQQIELLESVRRSGADYAQFVAYLDRSITTTILGQSSTTDQGPWRGTAEVQKDVRDETVAADGRLLDKAINLTIVRWLTQWNFPGAAVPVLHRDTEPPEDLNKRSEREETISRTTGRRPTMRHVENTYGGEWEDKPAPAPPAGQGMPGRGGSGPMQFAAGDLDAIGREALLVSEDWRPYMEPVVKPLLDAAKEAADFEDYRERLSNIDEDMDASRVVDRLHRGSFSAALSGDAGLEDET